MRLLRSTSIRLAFVPCMLLAGCYHDASSSAQPGFAFPVGVATDAASASMIRGIYPDARQDVNCCWVTDNVSFRTASDPDAKFLKLRIWVPTFAPWSTAPGAVSLMNAHGAAFAKVALKTGYQDVLLPLPKNAVSANGDVSVQLHFSGAHVPKNYGLNGDVRNLSAMMINVTTTAPYPL